MSGKREALAKAAECMALLEKHGALSPQTIEAPDENAFADAMIVASATSGRHAKGMADALSRLCAEKNFQLLGMEGYGQAEWVLLDLGDVIVHILRGEARDLYKLEDLWARRARLVKEEGRQ